MKLNDIVDAPESGDIVEAPGVGRGNSPGSRSNQYRKDGSPGAGRIAKSNNQFRSVMPGSSKRNRRKGGEREIGPNDTLTRTKAPRKIPQGQSSKQKIDKGDKLGNKTAGGVLAKSQQNAINRAIAQQNQNNIEKSKQTGVYGDFAKHRKDMKVGRVVQHPDGIFYRLEKTDKGSQWMEVDGVKAKKEKDGSTTFDTQYAKPVKGVYPLAPKDARSMELTSIAKGVGQGPGAIEKMKQAGADAINKAIGGPLASKTRMDPDASTAQKVGAVAGAGIGRAMANVLKKGPAPEKTGGDIRDRHNGQLRFALEEPLTMFKVAKTDSEKIEYAKQWIDKLAAFKKQRPDISGLDDYAIQFGAMLKNSPLKKTEPEWYGSFMPKVRAMAKESYDALNTIFEANGITWEQCGYKVLISEKKGADVLLVPTKVIDELNEAIELEELKKLAGV